MKRELKELISRTMGEDVENLAPRAGTLTQRDYNRALDQWARRVRRDILIIEYHLVKLGVDPAEFYGDPGDPPPPPD